MPVYRFRDLDEANRALWLPPGDPALAKRWEALFELSQIAPSVPPFRGVLKFSSIEEANRHREDWIQQRVDAGKARIAERGS